VTDTILPEPFIWFDIETTGLEPDTEDMLEIGIVISNLDLVPVAAYENLIKPTLSGSVEAARTRASEYVRNMHDESGLWSDLGLGGEPKGTDLPVVEEQIIAWLTEQADVLGFDLSKQPICGSSAQFDRAFLLGWMPRVHDLFHYRNVDISSIKEVVRRRRPDVYATLPPKEERHRVLPDLYDTLREADHYFTNTGI
jgi:oligoribonuclease